MQTIKAGAVSIGITGLLWGAGSVNGAPVESLRVSFPDDITGEQLEALLSNPWEILHEDGTLIGMQAGINRVEEYSILFFKVPDEAQQQAQLNEMARQLAAAKQEREAMAGQVEAANKERDDALTTVEQASAGLAMYQEALYRMGMNPAPEAVAAMLAGGIVEAVPAEQDPAATEQLAPAIEPVKTAAKAKKGPARPRNA